jgi:hypothetical protein
MWISDSYEGDGHTCPRYHLANAPHWTYLHLNTKSKPHPRSHIRPHLRASPEPEPHSALQPPTPISNLNFTKMRLNLLAILLAILLAATSLTIAEQPPALAASMRITQVHITTLTSPFSGCDTVCNQAYDMFMGVSFFIFLIARRTLTVNRTTAV